MSKKVEDALVALELRTTKICNASGSQVIKTIFDEECNKHTGIILAEFAKLNAVREKLVEACKEMQRTLDKASGRVLLDSTRSELAPWVPMIEAALAANAELEGK